MVLPFETQVPKGSGNAVELKTDPDALRALLSWLVDGLLDYLHNGLDTDVPAEVAKVQESALSQVNEFRRWCDRTFTTDGKVPTSKRVTRETAWALWEHDRKMGRVPSTVGKLNDPDEFQERMRAIYGKSTPRKLPVVNKKTGEKSRVTFNYYDTPFMLRHNSAGK